jgi:uncharacterized protein (DUF305 family)
VLAGTLLVAGSDGSRAQDHGTHAAPAAGASGTFAHGMTAAMQKMHEAMASAATTGDPDRDFLAAMIPHHEGAIEMARLVLIHGKDPLVRRLAEEIISGQQSEIQAMRGRLQTLEQAPRPNAGEYPALGSTRGTR